MTLGYLSSIEFTKKPTLELIHVPAVAGSRRNGFRDVYPCQTSIFYSQMVLQDIGD